MSEIDINVFQAGRGDCILVSCVGKTTTNVLIDMGVKGTYENSVKQVLEVISSKGENLDLLVLTHVDDDHLGGAISFFADNGDFSNQKINVRDTWFNSYRHLSHQRSTNVINSRIRKSVKRQITISDHKDSKISAEEGTTVAGMLYKYNYPWNKAFDSEAILGGSEPILLNGEVKVTVLTPTIKQISELQKVWLKKLKRKFPEIIFNDDEFLDDAIFYATKYLVDENEIDSGELISRKIAKIDKGNFSEDTSVINASSITFILEYCNKRILFLADSPPSVVLSQLKERYPDMNKSNPLHFDLIKISHHGSKRNTSSKLLEQVSCDKFIFSTSGTYGHPHLETISRILLITHGDKVKKLYFNYETDTFNALNREDWMRKYNYTIHKIDQESIRILID